MTISTILGRVMPFVAAGAVATVLYYLITAVLSMTGGVGKVVKDYHSAGQEQARQPGAAPADETGFGTQEYKIRLTFAKYGLKVDGWEQAAVYLVSGALAAAIILLLLITRMPISLFLVAPVLGYFVVTGMVNGHWSGVSLEFEKEIPTALLRMSSLLQANPNVIETMDNLADGLDPDKPLGKWLKRLASKIQASGQTGIKMMQAEAEAVSPSLLLMVVLVGRIWETGGEGYNQALHLASDNLADLMETRTEASAIAAGAWSTVRIILVSLGVTLGAVLLNPMSRDYFQGALIQGLLLAVVLWAVYGYWQLNESIKEVVE